MARAMKDSGVAWIGEIPQGWEVLRGKDIFAKRSLQAFDTDEIVTCFRDGQVTLRKNRREDGFTIALKEHGYQGVRAGDLVVHAMDAFAGAIGISESNGKCSPVYSICRARHPTKTDLRFYSYVLRDMALNGYIQSVGQGIRERSTDFRFREVEVAFYCQPTLDEQRAIADYLDRQAALIDQRLTTLAEKKTVLAELRKAVIHEAVTKGLNKTAPMKNSCVAWIGAVPSHWTRLRIKDVCRDYLGQAEKDAGNYVGLEHITPWLGTYQAADRAEAAASTGQFISEGVVCFSKLRPYLAKAFVAKESLFVTTELLTFVPRRAVVDARFLTRYLLTHGFIAEVNDAVAGTKMPRVDWHTLATRIIFLPPISEQRAIADYLDRQTVLIDAQLSTLDEQAQVLKELRKAIIHEAVTGKIDLTGYAPPSPEALAA